MSVRTPLRRPISPNSQAGPTSATWRSGTTLRVLGEAGLDEAPGLELLLAPPGSSGAADPVGVLLARWTRRGLAARLPESRAAVVAAAAAPADGVTLVLRLHPLPPLPVLVRLARGGPGRRMPSGPVWRQLLAVRPAQTRLDVVPGYARA